MIYKSKQTWTALWVHLIWSTKYREPLITPNLKFKLYDYIRLVSKNKKYHLDFINGVPDHVHLLYSSRFAKKLFWYKKITSCKTID